MKSSVLNTRPTSSNRETTQVFHNNGFDVIEFPCIEIACIQDKSIQQQIVLTKQADVIIFTSQNAVNCAFGLYPNWKIPIATIIIAVGHKTSECLEQNCGADIWVPKIQNSQGVIDLLKGIKNFHNISLITAANGRQEIQKFATSIGVELQQINVYQRQLPHVNDAALRDLTAQIDSQEINILATSVTTLENLKLLLPSSYWQKFLLNTVVCASSRIEEKAKSMGFTQIINSHSAKAENMSKAIISQR
jgi:uroporphyrinogen-III synthase